MKNVGIIGFYASGSSAVVDLLKEFDDVGVALDKDANGNKRPYEHVPFVTSGGIFECVSLFDNCGSIYQSDMIVNNFIRSNERLYYNNFVSFGSYKWIIGEKFLDLSKEFIKDIGASTEGGMTTEHKTGVRFSPIYAALQIAAKIVYKKPIYKIGKKNLTDGRPTYWAAPTHEELYDAARKYIKGYFDLCKQDEKELMIYDQIIRPQNTIFLDSLFDDSFKAIIVQRDARDIFFLSKYFFSKPPYSFWSAPLPTDVNLFCKYWDKNTRFDSNNKKLLIIQFEDLIYKYEESVGRIADFLDLDKTKHVRKRKFFDPEKSINNTQTYYETDESESEAKIIEEKLPRCIYKFPYVRKTALSSMFDNPEESKKR